MKNRDKIFMSILLIAFATLITFMVVGNVYEVKALSIVGFAIFIVSVLGVMATAFITFIKDLNKELKKNSKTERTLEEDEKLLNNIYTAKSKTEREIAKAAYIGEGCDSAGELILSSFGLSKESRKAFKHASFKDKFITVFYYVFIFTCIITFGIGAALCNLSVTIGLSICGAAAVGLAGIIIITLIINKVQHNNFYKSPKIKDRKYSTKSKRNNKKSKDELIDNSKIQKAIVKRCVNHSVGKHGHLYSILVFNSDEKYEFKMLTNKYHLKGDVVYYYQNGNKRTVVEDYEDSLEK